MTVTHLPDISSIAFWSRPARERDAAFAWLREHEPVSFHPPPEGGLLPSSTEFWAIVRHEDVAEVSRHPETFCSSRGVGFDDMPQEMAEPIGSFLVMDDPRHTVLRKLIAGTFTTKAVRQIDDQIRRQAERIVAESFSDREFDVVERISMKLPLWTISEMIGVPEELRETVFHAANVMVGTNDPDFVEPGATGLQTMLGAVVELTTIAKDLARERRAKPRNDLMTALVEAEVDGHRLTDEEIGAFMVLLSVAGNDTTRNTISHTMLAFSDHPEQWDLLRTDVQGRMSSAVEEFVRWASPVMDFRRTATRDVELAGRSIGEGDKVVMFYGSANRDATIFEDPWRFDILRDPNRHLGFGGGGPHYCLGASLAKTQLRSVFTEVAKRARRIEAETPTYLVGNFIDGIKSLGCRFEAAN